MAKIKLIYPKVSTWSDLNLKLLKHYGVPHGSRFSLCRKGKTSSTRPFVRADYEIRRKLFRRDDHPCGDDVRVIEVCHNIEAMLAPGSRAKVVAFRPDGTPLDGKTTLRTWRKLPGKPTQEERDSAEAHRLMVEDIRRLAVRSLGDLEEAIEDPCSVVTDAMMMALIDRYDVQAVRASFRRLRL